MQPIKYQIAPFSQVFQFLSNIQQYNAHHPRCLSPSASEAIQLCCRHIFGNIPRSKSSEVPKPMRDFISCVEELRRRRAVYIDFCNDSMNVIYQFQDGYMNTRTIIGRLWAANVHKGFTVNNESAFSTSFGNRSSGVLNPGATDFVPKFPIAKTDAVVKSADNDKIVNSEAESTSGSWGTPTSSVTKTSPASTLVGWIPYESDDSFEQILEEADKQLEFVLSLNTDYGESDTQSNSDFIGDTSELDELQPPFPDLDEIQCDFQSLDEVESDLEWDIDAQLDLPETIDAINKVLNPAESLEELDARIEEEETERARREGWIQ